MKISIVTPSHKQLEWLKLCTASVADQQGVAFEHIIQDACSGQELTDWVQTHTHTKLFVERDSGMYDAINRGFIKATGDIVAWLNCDEQYLPGALAKVAAFFEQHPKVDVVFGDVILLGENGNLLSYRRAIPPSLLHIQLSHLNTLSCGTFIRRSVIERGFMLDTEWRTIADAVWVASLIKGKLRMAVLPEPLAAFTITTANLGQSSLAFKEGEKWQRQLVPRWALWLKSPVIFWHRIRKFIHGAYAVRNFSTEVYTHSSPHQRVRISSKRLTFAWKKAQPQLGVTSTWLNPLDKIRRFLGIDESLHLSHSRALPFSFYHPPRWPWIYCLLIPILLTLLILFLEKETSTAIIVAPMLSTSLMLALSFVLEPLQLVPFAVAFTGAIFYSLQYMSTFDGSQEAWIRLILRLISFVFTATLAILFSKSRCEAKARQDQTMDILTTMPMPVVISDAMGAIIFANDEAVDFLKIPRGELVGKSYARLFMPFHDEGTAMRDYIQYFQMPSEGSGHSFPDTICIAQKEGAPQQVNARFICLGKGESRYMVTVIKI